MAKPRIFVSSTFYDLRQIRTDLSAFIEGLGYEPVMHERGGVAYGKEQKLEEYCYREIQSVDVVVSIVGSKFGSTSQYEGKSISQVELDTALKQGKQVYIFIEQSVQAEYRTYAKNKAAAETIQWQAVDKVDVYKYLDIVHSLPLNNQMHGFSTAQDIIRILKEQWAGLFQRFLSQDEQTAQAAVLAKMENLTGTLNQLVGSLIASKDIASSAVDTIVATSHPLFGRLRTVLQLEFPVYFRSLIELNGIVKTKMFRMTDPSRDPDWRDGYYRWTASTHDVLEIAVALFDDQSHLIPMSESEWDDSYLHCNLLPF